MNVKAGATTNETGVVPEELVTVKEYAYLFGYHPNSVWRRVRAGRMPNAFKDGRSVRIRVPSDLVASLRARLEPPTPAVSRTGR